ncbi:MAG: hypothetical protein II518_05735 [Candidatus Methanomethylophilus sp.]|nr:hypothetical protein [Methanomethylophilus sp.]
MIDTTTTGKIKFYYKRDVLFNEISLMSNYMAKNLSTKDGNSLTDEYAISDDEKDLVDVCIRAALPDIYEAMTKITSTVTNAFDDDAIISGDHCVVFTLQDNDAYNSNVLTLVDASLNNCIKQGTLKEIYSTIVNPEFFKISADRFVAELFKLKQRLFQLKKKSVVSNLS